MAPDGPVSPGGADYRRRHLVPRSGGAVTAAAARLDPYGPCDCVAAAVVVAVCCAGAGFVAAVVGSRIHCIVLVVGMCLVLVVAVVGLLIVVVVVGLVDLVGCFAAVGLDSIAGLGSTLYWTAAVVDCWRDDEAAEAEAHVEQRHSPDPAAAAGSAVAAGALI